MSNPPPPPRSRNNRTGGLSNTLSLDERGWQRKGRNLYRVRNKQQLRWGTERKRNVYRVRNNNNRREGKMNQPQKE